MQQVLEIERTNVIFNTKYFFRLFFPFFFNFNLYTGYLDPIEDSYVRKGIQNIS